MGITECSCGKHTCSHSYPKIDIWVGRFLPLFMGKLAKKKKKRFHIKFSYKLYGKCHKLEYRFWAGNGFSWKCYA